MLWLAGVLLALVLVAPVGQSLRQPGELRHLQVAEYFNFGHVSAPHAIVQRTGFLSDAQGFFLPGRTAGRLIYRIDKPVGQRLFVNVWVFDGYTYETGSIKLRLDQGPERTISLNQNLEGKELALGQGVDAARQVELIFDTTNNSSTDAQVLAELIYRVGSGSPPTPPPAFSYLGLALLTALIAAVLLRQPRGSKLAIAVAIGAIVALGAELRMSELFPSATHALDGDAFVYRIYGEQFQWWPPWDSGLFSAAFSEREPLYPMVVHIYFSILGDTDFHLRVVSSTLSSLAVVLSVVAARRRVSWPASLLIGLIIALNGPLADESVRALRTELEMCGVLVFYILVDTPSRRRPWLNALLLGAAGSAVVLTRTFYLATVLTASAISQFSRHRPVRLAMSAFALTAIMVLGSTVGHRVAMYEQIHSASYSPPHDAFYDTAGYARWFANIEKFEQHRNLPHPELFPTQDEYDRSGPYTGPRITYLQYLFLMHTPQELVGDSIAGMVDVFHSSGGFMQRGVAGIGYSPGSVLEEVAHVVDGAARWLALVGLVAMIVSSVRRPRNLVLPLIVLGTLGFSAFLIHRGLLERYRNSIEMYPLALTAGAWVLESAIRRSGVDAVGLGRWLQARFTLRYQPAWLGGLVAGAALLIVIGRPLDTTELSIAGSAVALGLAILAYDEPWLGVTAMLVTLALVGPRLGLASAVATAIGAAVRQRPSPRTLWPLTVVLLLAAALAVSGLDYGLGLRAHVHALAYASTFAAAVIAVALAFGSQASRDKLALGLAALGIAVAAAALLVGVNGREATFGLLSLPALVATGWLLSRPGVRTWWLVIPLVALSAVLITLVPIGIAVGGAVALAWLAARSRRLRARSLALGTVAALLALGSLEATLAAVVPTPSGHLAWRTFLADPSWTLSQDLTLPATADSDHLWLYCRRASESGSFQTTIAVNGLAAGTDIDSRLPFERLGWASLPIPTMAQGQSRLLVTIKLTGSPNMANGYLELGGVGGHATGLRATFSTGRVSSSTDLSPDPGLHHGTLLILPGDAVAPSVPPGLIVPPLTGDAWTVADGPPIRMAGEPPIPASADVSFAEPWPFAIQVAHSHPTFGVGLLGVGPALAADGLAVDPRLSARNQYLQSLAAGGIPVGVALLLLLIAAGFGAWRALPRQQPLLVGLWLALVLAMVSQSLFDDRVGAPVAWLVLGSCLAPLSGEGRGVAQIRRRSENDKVTTEDP